MAMKTGAEFKEIETLEVPQEIVELFEEGRVSEDCRDEAVKSYFYAKRAIFYAKNARECYDKTWRLFADLYPDMKAHEWSYTFSTKTLSRKKK